MADDLSSNPTFTALPSKAGSEWYVLVSWHDGRVPEHVTGFQTEDDARGWILKKSADWLQKRDSSTAP
jgi:hypothetical protein